jgi:hypothetical protein
VPIAGPRYLVAARKRRLVARAYLAGITEVNALPPH